MLRQLSKISLYASLFAILVVMTSTLFPFIGGKDYFYRFTVELALVFFVLWWAFEDTEGEAVRRIKEMCKKPLFIAVTVFMIAMLLATFFAEDSHAAFWSNYERGEGTFQMLHYYVSFLLMSVLFTSEKDWKRAFKVSLVAASGMILYGLFGALQWADNFITPFQGGSPPPTLWGRLIEPRFQGTLGNPAYVAPYLMFAMFYAAYLWATSEKRRKTAAIVGWILFMLSLLFFFLLSQTRGALMGLGAAIFAFLVYLVYSEPAWRKKLYVALAAFLLVSGLLVTFRQSNFVRSLPGGRIFDIAFSEDTVQTRVWTWGSAWKGFLERPIFGWGQENFSAVFDKYFDPRHFSPLHNSETWFDRAHSLVLDYLAETGIVGFLSYLAIFVVIYWQFFRKRMKEGVLSRQAAIVQALVLALPIGYWIQGLAIFDVLPMYVNLFLFFAFGYYYFYHAHESAA